MKNENIKKINTLGKVGRVLSIITLVICILGVIFCFFGAAIINSVPDDIFNADISGGGTVSVRVDEDQKMTVKKEVRYGGVSVKTGKNSENLLEPFNIDRRFGNMDVKVQFLKNEEKTTDETEIYDVDVNINGNGGVTFKDVIKMLSIMGGVLSACLTVAVIFAGRLCKALEKCESPFGENVIKKMRAFTISLIPWGLASVYIGGFSAIGLAFIIVIVILVFTIFKYGAQLQQESDETL